MPHPRECSSQSKQKDIADVVNVCFRKPSDGEQVKAISTTQMLTVIQKEYPLIKGSHSIKVQLGLVMKDMRGG